MHKQIVLRKCKWGKKAKNGAVPAIKDSDFKQLLLTPMVKLPVFRFNFYKYNHFISNHLLCLWLWLCFFECKSEAKPKEIFWKMASLGRSTSWHFANYFWLLSPVNSFHIINRLVILTWNHHKVGPLVVVRKKYTISQK